MDCMKNQGLSQIPPYPLWSDEKISELVSIVKEPIRVKEICGTSVNFYDEIVDDRLYLVGIHPSDGNGLSKYAITVITYHDDISNDYTKCTPVIVADVGPCDMTINDCGVFLRDFFIMLNYPIISIMRNGNGGTIIDMILSTDIHKYTFNYHDQTKAKYGKIINPKMYQSAISGACAYSMIMQKVSGGYITQNILDNLKSIIVKNYKLQPDVGCSIESILSFFMAYNALTLYE